MQGQPSNGGRHDIRATTGKTVEAYVDDILVKSKRREDHISDLKAAFDLMKKHNMRLNPEKCAFGFASGKFLGYMVTPRGIEANPNKVTAILEMEAPKTVTEIQRLAGRITALGRFIARSGDRCGTFFKVLRGLKKRRELGLGIQSASRPSKN
jgi:hypothetical protein